MSDHPKAVDPYAFGSFVPIFDHLKMVPGLTHAHHRLYGVLASFRGRGREAACSPRLSAICGRYGTTDERSVRRLLSDLERAGVIGIDRSGNGQGKPSSYSFLLHPGMVEKTRGASSPGGQAHPEPGGDVDPEPAGQEHPGPGGENTAQLKNLVKNLQEEPLQKGERAIARPGSAEPMLADGMSADGGVYWAELWRIWSEEALRQGYTAAPRPTRDQQGKAAGLIRDMARSSGQSFAECALAHSRHVLANAKSGKAWLEFLSPGKQTVHQVAPPERVPSRQTDAPALVALETALSAEMRKRGDVAPAVGREIGQRAAQRVREHASTSGGSLEDSAALLAASWAANGNGNAWKLCDLPFRDAADFQGRGRPLRARATTGADFEGADVEAQLVRLKGGQNGHA